MAHLEVVKGLDDNNVKIDIFKPALEQVTSELKQEEDLSDGALALALEKGDVGADIDTQTVLNQAWAAAFANPPNNANANANANGPALPPVIRRTWYFRLLAYVIVFLAVCIMLLPVFEIVWYFVVVFHYHASCEHRLELWLILNGFSFFDYKLMTENRLIVFSTRAFWFSTVCYGSLVNTFNASSPDDVRPCSDKIYWFVFWSNNLQWLWILSKCCTCCKSVCKIFSSNEFSTGVQIGQFQPRHHRTLQGDHIDRINARLTTSTLLADVPNESKTNESKTETNESKTDSNKKESPKNLLFRDLLSYKVVEKKYVDPASLWLTEVMVVLPLLPLSNLVVDYLKSDIWVLSAHSKFPVIEMSRYNPFTGRIVAVPITKMPRIRFNPVIRVLFQERVILVLGGIGKTDDGNECVLNRVDAFRVNKCEWERWPPLPLQFPLLQNVHSKLRREEELVLGERLPIVDAIVMPDAFAYVEKIGTTTPPAPEALQLAIKGETLLVLGPAVVEPNGTRTRMSHVLEVRTKTWQEETIKLPMQPTNGATIVAHPTIPQTLLAVGGYDLTEESRSELAPLSRFSSFCIPTPEQILSGQLGILHKTDGAWDYSAKAWTSWPKFHYGRERPEVCFMEQGTKMIVYGGEAFGVFCASVECFDFKTDKWTIIPLLPSRIDTDDKSSSIVARTSAPRLFPMYDTLLHFPPCGFSIIPGDKEWHCRIDGEHAEHLDTTSFKKLLCSELACL